jgi:hypothetical protein
VCFVIMRIFAAASPRLPLCLRRRCRGTLRYWEPCAFLEALVSIFSGMLLWMGFWDLIEMLLPSDAFTRAAMILIGVMGLFATRTMYDKSVLEVTRGSEDRIERDDAAMLSSMEMAIRGGGSDGGGCGSCGSAVGGGSSTCGSDGHTGRCSCSSGNDMSSAAGGGGDGLGSSSSSSSSSCNCSCSSSSAIVAAADRGPRAVQSDDGAARAGHGSLAKTDEEDTTTRSQSLATATRPAPPPTTTTARPPRRFFDAPPPDARRCGRALFAILVGLTLWVGLWDLVDYHLIPAAFPGAHNTSSICEAADADPGPAQLLLAPGCVVVRLALFAIGVGGLWVTRSLYGTVQVHAAQFSRFS